MSRKNKHNKIEELLPGHFTLKKTTYHGFPNGPTALAYDVDTHLLAVGTKLGELRVFGRPGVEFRAFAANKSAIKSIFFISSVHQLLTVSIDNSITAWELSTDGQPALTVSSEFIMDLEPDKAITKCCLSQHSGHFYIGTEGGNVYTLDLKNFRIDTEVILWNNATTLIQPSTKTNPGRIVSLELCPISSSLILIGYEKGIIVLWDFENGLPTKNFPSNIHDCQLVCQPLESISWLNDGVKFISSHSNSSINFWNLTSCTPCEGPVLHYGSECVAVTKIQWLNTDAKPLIIFSGGLPSDQAEDHHTVTVIQGTDHLALDFTSPVVDFVSISDPVTHRGTALIVLCEQELVAFDLEAPKCPQICKPYLYCLHSSPVTCVRLFENCTAQLYEALLEVTVVSPPAHHHRSTMEWPAMGGCVRSSEPTMFDILVTGHENGTVKFWDVTSGAMRLIYEVKTSNLFVGQETESALVEEFSDFKWPPYHKVSVYDPFEDDPRLAIKMIEFCPTSLSLCVGGNGGQVISFSLSPFPNEVTVPVAKAEIFVGPSTSGGGRGGGGATFGCVLRLEYKEDKITLPAGFQANFCIQCIPATPITALAFRPSWGLIAAGISKGFTVANFLIKQIVLVHPTIQSDGSGSRSISRLQSLRRSLRGSVHKRQNTANAASRRRVIDSLNIEANISSSRNKGSSAQRQRSNTDITSPHNEASRPVAADYQVPSELLGHVTHLCFCDTHGTGGGTSPVLFASTMGSFLIRYCLTLPDPRERLTQINRFFPAGKDYALVHAAPVVCVFILDYDGIPIPGPYEVESRVVSAPNLRSPHFAVICTAEQVKIISLPGMKQKRKEKVSGHIHERIYKAWIIRVKVPAAPVGAARDWNPALGVLTNAGTFLAFSLPDLRLCFQEPDMLDMNDQKAMQSFTVSMYGEILYLHSFSELERCLMCSYAFSYHSSMLPSLFAYEGSTAIAMKKSVQCRKRVVQVEVSNENSSTRERRSETPSPEDMTEATARSGSSSKYQDDGLVAAVNSEPATSSLEAAGTQHAATTVASKKSKSPESCSKPSQSARMQSVSSSSSSGESSSSDSESSGDEDGAQQGDDQEGRTYGNSFAMNLEELDEGNQELDNIIASSLQQLESARAFYEHMQARAKK